MWQKLAVLAPHALATTGVAGPIGAARANAEVLDHMRNGTLEIVAVAARAGHHPQQGPADGRSRALPGRHASIDAARPRGGARTGDRQHRRPDHQAGPRAGCAGDLHGVASRARSCTGCRAAVTTTASIRARMLAVPFSRPRSSPNYHFTHLYTILCEVTGDGGERGIAGLWFPRREQAAVVLEALRYLAPIASAHPDPRAAVTALRREMSFLGYKGVSVMAMSGLEMALFDLRLRTGQTTLPPPRRNSGACLLERLLPQRDTRRVAWRRREGRCARLHRVQSSRRAAGARRG